MLSKEMLVNVSIFLERTPVNGHKEALALVQTMEAVNEAIAALNAPPPKGEVE